MYDTPPKHTHTHTSIHTHRRTLIHMYICKCHVESVAYFLTPASQSGKGFVEKSRKRGAKNEVKTEGKQVN